MTKFVFQKAIDNFHLRILFLALVVYSITAIYSKGYFHYDEHYQIIEFANLKLGLNEKSDLAWEYRAQIRPAIQPAICVVLFRLLHITGITDSYILTLSLRILTLILSLTAITFFIYSSCLLVDIKHRKLYITLSYFLWFLPFLNVRFSSETWSGMLFLLAVSVLQRYPSKRRGICIIAGLLLGFSFLCRFQSAFLIVGLLGWLIVIHRESAKNICMIIGAIIIAPITGTIIDYWFYGNLVFTPWNYFDVNILQGVASNFGTSPWYYYIGTILSEARFPLGWIILSCLCILIYYRPRSFLLWIILPFLIVHSIIPHKEDRFLIPIINFIPLMITLGWQEIDSRIPFISRNKIYRITVWITIILLVVNNISGLVVMAVKPMGNGAKAVTYYVDKHYRDGPINLIYGVDTNPYNPLYRLSLYENMYANKRVREINILQFLNDKTLSINKNETTLFAFEKQDVEYPNNQFVINRLHLKLKFESIPVWIQRICKYDNQFQNNSVIVLYGNK